jgi:hypothetical protein
VEQFLALDLRLTERFVRFWAGRHGTTLPYGTSSASPSGAG